jgi:hypothetical protein
MTSSRRIAGSGAVVLALVAGSVHAEPAPEDPRLARSREIVARFQGELSGRLSEAIAAGGPVHAIEVCSRDAPAIASRLSSESGASVARVALAARNADNTGDARERAILEGFRADMRAGNREAAVRFDVAADGSARYMKAIITQPVCLACHGPKLAPEVESAVLQRYPADQATGYSVGDLRGAFVVRWPPAGPAGVP